MPDEFPVRFKALRERLGLTQAQLAERCGWDPEGRTKIVKVEGGVNKVSTAEMREALARGLGMDETDLELFIEGAIDVDEAYRRIQDRDAVLRERGFDNVQIALLQIGPGKIMKEAVLQVQRRFAQRRSDPTVEEAKQALLEADKKYRVDESGETGGGLLKERPKTRRQ